MVKRSSKRRTECLFNLCFCCTIVIVILFVVWGVSRLPTVNERRQRQHQEQMRAARVRQQRYMASSNDLPKITMHPLEWLDANSAATALGIIPAVRSKAALCDTSGHFDLMSYGGAVADGFSKFRNVIFRDAATIVSDVALCSVEPSGSVATIATDATDVFFDSGAAEALSADIRSIFKRHQMQGGVRFIRKESSGTSNVNCPIVVTPLPFPTPPFDACRAHQQYPSNASSGLAGRTPLYETEAERGLRYLHQGEYEVTVTPFQVIIRARHGDGLRHAMTSVLQMALHRLTLEYEPRAEDAAQLSKLRSTGAGSKFRNRAADLIDGARGVSMLPEKQAKIKLAIPTVSFRDAPQNPWRGLMIDLARHFHTAEELQRVVVSMAWRKLNRLQLHLTDDQGYRMQSHLFPSLATLGGKRGPPLNGKVQVKHAKSLPYSTPAFLTIKEIHDLSDFAAARGVMLVPEIDLPGHAAAALIGLEPEVGPGPKISVRMANLIVDARNGTSSSALRDELAILPRRCKQVNKALQDLQQELTKLRMRNRRGLEAEADKLPIAATEYRFGYLNPQGNPDCGEIPMAKLGKGDKSGAPNCMAGLHGIFNPDTDGELLMKAILAEVAAVFDRADYIHIGGDQAGSLRDMAWARFLNRDAEGGDSSTNALQARLMNSLAVFVRDELGRRPIVWDDTLLESGPDYVPPPGTVVALWREDGVSWTDIRSRAAKFVTSEAHQRSIHLPPHSDESIRLGRDGISVIYMGKTRLYLDYIQYLPPKSNRGYPHVQQPPPFMKHRAVTFKRAYLSRFAIPERIEGSMRDRVEKFSVLGLQACLWTELVRDEAQLQYQLFPRIYALADAAWHGSRSGAFSVDPGSPVAVALRPRIKSDDEDGALVGLLRWITHGIVTSQPTVAPVSGGSANSASAGEGDNAGQLPSE